MNFHPLVPFTGTKPHPFSIRNAQSLPCLWNPRRSDCRPKSTLLQTGMYIQQQEYSCSSAGILLYLSQLWYTESKSKDNVLQLVLQCTTYVLHHPATLCQFCQPLWEMHLYNQQSSTFQNSEQIGSCLNHVIGNSSMNLAPVPGFNTTATKKQE